MAIKPSPRLAMLLLLSHAMAAAAACLTTVPQAVRLALLGAVLLSFSHHLARDALLLLPGSWREISLENHPHPDLPAGGFIAGLRGGACRVSVTGRDGSVFAGKVAAHTVVTPWFAVLRIRPEGRRLPVFRILLPDMLDAGEFRELRVRLKFQ